MSERGFAKSKTMKGALYSGVGLRTEDHYDTPRAPHLPGQISFKNDEDGEEV